MLNSARDHLKRIHKKCEKAEFGMWRLLENGEIIKRGDEFFALPTEKWLPVHDDLIDKFYTDLKKAYWPIRRKYTKVISNPATCDPPGLVCQECSKLNYCDKSLEGCIIYNNKP